MLDYKRMTLKELDAITDMYVESFNAPPWRDAWTKETAGRRLRQMIEAEGFYGMCAYEDGMLCGMILGHTEQYYDGIIFEIKEFCVNNHMRGKGTGTAVYREFEKRLREEGIERLKLLTLRGEATEHFYRKLGYETDEEMIIMSKKLKAEEYREN